MAWYLDTSAFLKLAVQEQHSRRMRDWATAQEADGRLLWSCDLLRTEACRAARRVSAAALDAVQDRLERIALVSVTTVVFERAAQLGPPSLRTLDALHLAAALRLGEDLEGVVTYDVRLAQAAATLGLRTLAPGIGSTRTTP